MGELMGLFGLSWNSGTVPAAPAGSPVLMPPYNPAPGSGKGPPRLLVDQGLSVAAHDNPNSPGNGGGSLFKSDASAPIDASGVADGAALGNSAAPLDQWSSAVGPVATQAADDSGNPYADSADTPTVAPPQANDGDGRVRDDTASAPTVLAKPPRLAGASQNHAPRVSAEPPRLGSAGTANGSGTRPAAPAKISPSGLAAAAGKGPPKVPDYSRFSQIYSDWARSHGDAPHYVPASDWKQIKPDPTKLAPESKYGPYSRITFHHTVSENTPQSVDDFDMHKEPPWHFLLREVKNGGHAEKYDNNGDISYHFLIDKDGTIYEGRPLNYEGAHVSGSNPGNIGVAFLGDYSSKGFGDAQVNAAKTLIRVLNHAYGIGQSANGRQYIFTHRELAPANDARPEEFVGKADQQMNQIKAWSQTRGPGN